jgi:hypothetical protein
MGVSDDFDPELAFFGHDAERTFDGWLPRFRADLGSTLPGFMARSVEWPWLHASFDRIVVQPDGVRRFVQIKSAHQFAARKWDGDEPPLEVQAQVQAEVAVSGEPGEYVGLILGGRKGSVRWVPRDEVFIREYVIPRTREFWEHNVVPKIAPEPSTLGEVADVYPSTPGSSIVGSEAVLEAADRRAVLLSDARAQEAEADALTLAIAQYLGSNETLLDEAGNPVLTYKTQLGRRKVTDLNHLEATHPEYVTRSAPYKVMRMAKKKEPTHE